MYAFAATGVGLELLSIQWNFEIYILSLPLSRFLSGYHGMTTGQKKENMKYMALITSLPPCTMLELRLNLVCGVVVSDVQHQYVYKALGAILIWKAQIICTSSISFIFFVGNVYRCPTE